MWRRGRVALAVATIAALAVFAGPAGGERAQRGGVIVIVNGGIKPRKLPRRVPVPVTVFLSGGVRTDDRSPIPRINWIRLELAWRGVMNTRGLPICPRRRLLSTDSRQAMAACGRALVGRGKVTARIFLPNQAPFSVRGTLLTFNGRTKEGRRAVWAHAYAQDPPTSFVIPFTVRHEPKLRRTVLVTTIRRSVGPWPRVARFQVQISRDFTYRGRRRSYLRASCPVPKRFTAGFLSFARATYAFAGGETISVESVRSCRARD